jgi:hypothetical protein
MDHVRREEREALLRQTEQERTAKAVAMLEGAETLFNRELSKLTEESHASDFSTINVNGLTKLMTKIIELRRLVHGQSTETIEHKGDCDLSKLSLDELRAWRELQAKVSKSSGEDEE